MDNNMIDGEIWKDVIGYEGYYSVSSHGRVRRDRIGNHMYVRRIVHGSINSHGYHKVDLCKNGISRTFSVHRLVCEIFLGRPSQECYEVNHIDGNKKNNRLENLEWTTREGNFLHAIENGLCGYGESNVSSKLTEKEVVEMRQLYICGNVTQRELSRKFGVGREHVSNILCRKSWKHLVG